MIAASLVTSVAVAVLVAGCGVSAAGPVMHRSAAAASSGAPTRKAPLKPSAKAPSVAKMTAAQRAAMNRWYDGATVVDAANVCGAVYRVYMDIVAVSSGTGSSSLEGDITSLQTAVAAALSRPPPVAADAVIWKRVLNAYNNAANDPTNSGFVAAIRSASGAAWRWTPSFGGTLLVCLNASPERHRRTLG
jgi:hypothetical protein